MDDNPIIIFHAFLKLTSFINYIIIKVEKDLYVLNFVGEIILVFMH